MIGMIPWGELPVQVYHSHVSECQLDVNASVCFACAADGSRIVLVCARALFLRSGHC